MIITLVRHAQVIQEYQGKYNGHIDIGLSKNGKLQAKELGKKLQNTKFDKVYCSDLLRAKETLKAFNLNIKPIYTKELREKSWGRHEGKSFDEIQNEGIKYENFEQWVNTLDGEDVNEYIQRVREYFYKNIFKNKAKNILVVTHSGVIKTLLGIINGLTLEHSFAIKLDYLSVKKIDTKSVLK